VLRPPGLGTPCDLGTLPRTVDPCPPERVTLPRVPGQRLGPKGLGTPPLYVWYHITVRSR